MFLSSKVFTILVFAKLKNKTHTTLRKNINAKNHQNISKQPIIP